MRNVANDRNLFIISRDEYDAKIKEAFEKGLAEGKAKAEEKAKKETKKVSKAKIKTPEGEVEYRATEKE